MAGSTNTFLKQHGQFITTIADLVGCGRHKVASLRGSVGALLILLGEALSVVHLLPWSQFVFPLFWYGYILLVDALNQRVHGRSLLAGRKAEFAVMLAVSALYWSFFEGYNQVIHNWVYLNTPPEVWLATTVKVVSFATVIPALYETAELLGGFRKKAEGFTLRPLLPARWHLPVFVLGVLLSLLPLLLPRLFFWSVWLGPLLVIDPINDRLGRPSVLRDWREGDLRRTGIWLLAGYTCGFFWEFWNYWAYTKWIYTVPVPDMPHIFEMPVLGFFGFGPFALETVAFWTMVWGSHDAKHCWVINSELRLGSTKRGSGRLPRRPLKPPELPGRKETPLSRLQAAQAQGAISHPPKAENPEPHGTAEAPNLPISSLPQQESKPGGALTAE